MRVQRHRSTGLRALTLVVIAALAAATLATTGLAAGPSMAETSMAQGRVGLDGSDATSPDGGELWFRVPIVPRSNDPAEMAALLDAIEVAKASGYTHILIADAIANQLDTSSSFHTLWLNNLDRVLAAAKAEPNPLTVVFSMATFGRCQGSLLRNDPQLATGFPLDTPVAVEGDRLVPLAPPTITNNSFTRYANNRFDGFGGYVPAHVAQAAGRTDAGSVVIARTAPDGSAVSAANLTQTFAVEPMTQYRLTIWVKTDQLHAASVVMRVRGENGRSLSSLARRGPDGFVHDGVTSDWTPFRVAFNSTTNTRATVAFGVEGLRAGSVRFDDLSIETTPTLNLLARPGLVEAAPSAAAARITVTETDGSTWVARQGTDFELVAGGAVVAGDPALPRFGVDHTPPTLRVVDGGRLDGAGGGRELRLEGYHAFVHFLGAVSCSWNDPAVFRMVERLVDHGERLGAEAFLIPHDEIRSGGWEPTDDPDSSTALGANVAGVFAAADRATDLPLHIWYDMLDPIVNDEPNHFHLRSTLTRPIPVPDGVTVLAWDDKPPAPRGGESAADRDRRVSDHRRAVIEAMDGRAERLLVAGYYDTTDVALDARLWADAMTDSGSSRLRGSIYATWGTGDLSDLDVFAEHWRTTTAPPPPPPPPPPVDGTIVGSIDDGGRALPLVADLFEAGADGQRAGYLRSVRPADDGRYEFTTAPGCYVIVLVSPAGTAFEGRSSRWVEGTACVAGGDEVAGPTGRVAEGGGDRPASVGGRITEPGGAAVAGVVVDLFASNADGSRSTFLGDATTSADGRFSFAVTADCFIVVAIAPDGRRFADGSGYDQRGVCVAPGADIDDLDAVLAP